jgi:hypothetical protein
MVDNVRGGSANASLPLIATDDIGGIQHQRVKVQFGADGSATDVSSANPLPVGGSPIGATNETAPATDTAAAGLNGRLQRIAQRLTSLIALLPASIGQKDTAGSLSVTLASDHGALPLPAGAATEATLAAQSAKLPSALSSDRLKTEAVGNVAHDGVDTGNPVKIGGRASSAIPAPTASGDRTELWTTLSGAALAAVGGHTAITGDGNANPAQVYAGGDNTQRPLGVAALIYGAGAQWDRQRSANGDAQANTGLAAAAGMQFNGASWDRQRNNVEGTLLASAARTATTSTATQINYNARGVILFLRITAASGTGGLQPRLFLVDALTDGQIAVIAAPTARTTTGSAAYVFYPGSTAAAFVDLTQNVSLPLPRSWAVTVIHGDASSYTYSLGFSYIL